MNARLGIRDIRALALAPTTPPTLFAGTGGSSVWQYTITVTPTPTCKPCFDEMSQRTAPDRFDLHPVQQALNIEHLSRLSDGGSTGIKVALASMYRVFWDGQVGRGLDERSCRLGRDEPPPSAFRRG